MRTNENANFILVVGANGLTRVSVNFVERQTFSSPFILYWKVSKWSRWAPFWLSTSKWDIKSSIMSTDQLLGSSQFSDMNQQRVETSRNAQCKARAKPLRTTSEPQNIIHTLKATSFVVESSHKTSKARESEPAKKKLRARRANSSVIHLHCYNVGVVEIVDRTPNPPFRKAPQLGQETSGKLRLHIETPVIEENHWTSMKDD